MSQLSPQMRAWGLAARLRGLLALCLLEDYVILNTSEHVSCIDKSNVNAFEVHFVLTSLNYICLFNSFNAGPVGLAAGAPQAERPSIVYYSLVWYGMV